MIVVWIIIRASVIIVVPDSTVALSLTADVFAGNPNADGNLCRCALGSGHARQRERLSETGVVNRAF